MKRDCKDIKEIERFVRSSILKLTFFVVVLIIFLKRDVYCSVVFIITSLMGYIRFYFMSDMLGAILNKKGEAPYWSIINYFLVFFITIMFFKRYCLGRDDVCVCCGILGITIVSFGIIFGCISGELRKMSITKRR